MSLLLLLLSGIVLLYRRPKAARVIIIASFALLWIASTPFIAERALRLLEAQTSPLNEQTQKASAIVILGGGTYFHAPEYAGQDTVSETTLVRLRYGARLQREFKLPILVTGGRPVGHGTSEALQMRTALEQDFQVPARWTEDSSDNTFENARNSYQTLQGIKKIYLVTHAWHMPRSAAAFRSAGFEVIEAPTAFTTRHRSNLVSFMPRAESMRDSSIFVHELIGLLWYRIKSATN
ncbi:MAG: YdcF family protein [Gallionella sp.]|jgi:uncharacterized SAM-binding protein YcdF (DUF218 family)